MSANPSVPLYESIYRSIYLGTILSTAFYGGSCMQVFFYYIHYPNDPSRTKALVALVWAFNTTHESLIISGAYKSIMSGLENPYSLLIGEPELIIQILLTALVAITTQGFFVYRIYIFNGKNIVVPLISAPIVIYPLAASLIYVWKALYIADGVHAIELFKLDDPFFTGMATSSFAAAAAVDVLIAVFLTFLLVRKRTATGFSSTAHILQRLTVFAVNAGIWTAAFAILSLVLLHIYPATLFHVLFSFPLCPVYCNTLLANLNARTYIRGETTAHNADVNLVTSSASPLSDGAKGDRRSRIVSFRTSVNMEGHDGIMVLPLVGNRPTGAISECACA